MSSSFISQTTYSSALRFGLSPIKPVEEEYREKIGKYKLVRKVIKLVPKQTYSYKDYTALFYEDVLRSISTPPKFEDAAIYDHLLQKSMKVLEISGLKEQVEKLEELRADRSPRSIATQHDILLDITTKISSMMTREGESKYYTETFLNSSDFQLSYFAELMDGSQTYKKFLNIMEYELRLLRGFVGASMQRGVTAAIRRFDEGRKTLRPLVDASDHFRVASMALKTYVEICNSEKVEQLFELKSLDAKKLNKEEFSRLRENYLLKLKFFEEKIYEKKPELFVTNIDFNQPTNNMWKNLIAATV
jgi:hypothetical protein